MSKEITYAVAGLAVLALLAFVISRQVARRAIAPRRWRTPTGTAWPAEPESLPGRPSTWDAKIR